MGISHVVDKPTSKLENIKGCQLGSTDCMFLNTNGNCSAEWCIFSQLPTMINTEKEITCFICNKNTKTVSVYSGITNYICPECQTKLIKIVDDRSCPICGNKIDINQSICNSCSSKLKEKINE